jgi:sec-independent protein translocase protein TatA
MNIFGVGLPEMAIILVVALLVFGPKKLPEIGKSVGKALRSFQDASKEFETQFKQEAEQIEQAIKSPATSATAEISPAKAATAVEISPVAEVTAEPISGDTSDHAVASNITAGSNGSTVT